MRATRSSPAVGGITLPGGLSAARISQMGVVTIYREPDRRCGGEHEVNDLMGWTPPIRIVRQMSPSQLDELSHQILQQREQLHR